MSLVKGIALDLKRYKSVAGPVAPPSDYWYDTSRYKTHGTITTATWVRRPSGLYELDFNSATPDYVEVTCPQCNFTSEDFSVVARVKADRVGVNQPMFMRGAYYSQGWYMNYESTNNIEFVTNQGGAAQVTESTHGNLVADTWWTLGISRSGTSVLLYVNGEDDTATAGAHTNPLTSAKTAKIGIYDDKTNQPFDGQMSFLRVYNYALSAGEHKNIHEMLVRE